MVAFLIFISRSGIIYSVIYGHDIDAIDIDISMNYEFG